MYDLKLKPNMTKDLYSYVVVVNVSLTSAVNLQVLQK